MAHVHVRRRESTKNRQSRPGSVRQEAEARLRLAREEADRLRAEAEARGVRTARARGEARLEAARKEAARIHAESDAEAVRLMAQATVRLPEIVAAMLRTLLPEMPC